MVVSPLGLHDLHGEAVLPLGLQRLVPIQHHQAGGSRPPEKLPALLPHALHAGHVLKREQGTELAHPQQAPVCSCLGWAALMWPLSPLAGWQFAVSLL